MVRQVTGDWQTNEPELRPLRDHVQKLDDEFNQFGIQHISREENWEADELVEQVFSD